MRSSKHRKSRPAEASRAHANPPVPAPVPAPKEDPATNIKNHDKDLFNSEYFSDVVVKCYGREWHLHRSILVRCPFFHKALTGSFEEARTRIVTISDPKPDLVGKMLEYIYTGEIDMEVSPEQPAMTEQLMDFFELGSFFLLSEVRKKAQERFRVYLDAELKGMLPPTQNPVVDFPKYIAIIKEVCGATTKAARDEFLPVLASFFSKGRRYLLTQPLTANMKATFAEFPDFGSAVLVDMMDVHTVV